MRSSSERPTDSPEAAGSVEPVPAVFSVQHFCVHDGPGTRSIVFFKGCPLRCEWCQNPESWEREPELAFKSHLCIACNTCVERCPKGAISEPGHWDPALCDLCMECVESCPSTAMTQFGEMLDVETIVERLRPEFPFYRSSGGGVTLSGGEATLFPTFVGRLTRALREENVHVALETCGLFGRLELDPEPKGRAWPLLSCVDLVLYDIKIFDDGEHRAHCGSGNETIKHNLACLATLAARGHGPTVWPRLPLIPSMTDAPANLVSWATWLRERGLKSLSLVPYHEMGASKRQWLVDKPPAPSLGPLADDAIEAARSILSGEGLEVYVSGEERWPRRRPAPSTGTAALSSASE